MITEKNKKYLHSYVFRSKLFWLGLMGLAILPFDGGDPDWKLIPHSLIAFFVITETFYCIIEWGAHIQLFLKIKKWYPPELEQRKKLLATSILCFLNIMGFLVIMHCS